MGEKIKTCTKCKFIGDDSLFIKRQNLCLECKKRAGREDRAKRGEELNRKQRENYHKTPETQAAITLIKRVIFE